MATEDNKEVKKERDGKDVNRIDEKECHDRTGCFHWQLGPGGTIYEVVDS